MRMRFDQKPIAFLLLCGVLLSNASILGAAQTDVYRSGSCEEKKIALTFDDGPHPHQTHRILDILEKNGVRATFFMIGVNVKNYPDAALEVARRGHEIGNHSYTHDAAQELREEALAEELGECEEILWDVCRYRPKLFRPPRGVIGVGAEHCLAQEGYHIVLWSLDTRDWECKNADAIVAAVLKRIQPGDIVLMHDYVANGKTPEALEQLLPRLLALGYEPVTVSELLGIG